MRSLISLHKISHVQFIFSLRQMIIILMNWERNYMVYQGYL
jgi:hypothetical protein